MTDTLKSIDEALSIPDNHSRIQVLKDNIANKWNDLQEVQASMCTLLEEKEIDEECEYLEFLLLRQTYSNLIKELLLEGELVGGESTSWWRLRWFGGEITGYHSGLS